MAVSRLGDYKVMVMNVELRITNEGLCISGVYARHSFGDGEKTPATLKQALHLKQSSVHEFKFEPPKV